MNDKEPKPGLGTVVYTNVPRAKDSELVNEADEESFPASDPPSFARGNADHVVGPKDDDGTGSAQKTGEAHSDDPQP